MRLLPQLTPENTPFWTGGADGQLRIAFCNDCDKAIHPPELVCPRCLSRSVAARPVQGTGTIYSYTVNHQPWLPGLAVPYAIAVIDIDGAPGVRITAQMTGCNPHDVHIGQRVSVVFEPAEDVWIPLFRPL